MAETGSSGPFGWWTGTGPDCACLPRAITPLSTTHGGQRAESCRETRAAWHRNRSDARQLLIGPNWHCAEGDRLRRTFPVDQRFFVIVPPGVPKPRWRYLLGSLD